jgi:hypothetical protein
VFCLDDVGTVLCLKDLFPVGLLVVGMVCFCDPFSMLGIGVGDRFLLVSSPFGFWDAVFFAIVGFG